MDEEGAEEDVEGDEDDGDSEDDEDDGDDLDEEGDEDPGDGDFGVGDETLTDGKGGCAGGCVFSSWRPVSPLCRAIHSSLSGSKMTNTLTIVVEGAMTTTFCGRYDGHLVPTGLGVVFCWTGASRGFPHAQRARGTPWESTRTEVPAWRTAW